MTHDPTHSLGSGVGASDGLGSGVGGSDSLGSGVVTHDPTHSLGSGVGASNSLGSGVGGSDSLGSGVVTHDPTHSLGSGVDASDSLGYGVVAHDPTQSLGSGVGASDSLGSGVVTGSGVPDPTHSLGSGVVTHDPTHSLGSWVVAYDPDHSLGSGVVACDVANSHGSGVDRPHSLGSEVGTHDSLGSWVVAYDPDHSLGSGVVACDVANSHGSGVVRPHSLGSWVGTHDPTHSLGSWVVAYDPDHSLESGLVTHDPSNSLGSGVKNRGPSGLGKRLYRRHKLIRGRTRPFYRDHSCHMPQGANCVGGNRLATVPRGALCIPNESTGGNARDEPYIRNSQRFSGNRADPMVDVRPEAPKEREIAGRGVNQGRLEAKPVTAWKVRMLSVRRPDNAGNAKPLVATEDQEPRLDADRVAPNVNGADMGRPSRSDARGQEGTESEDTDDSEHNSQDLRYYSDDGAESALGESEGHDRSRPDAASRGELRQFQVCRGETDLREEGA